MATYTTFARGGTTGNANAYTARADGYISAQFDVAKFVSTNAYVASDIEVLLSVPARSKFILEALYTDATLVIGATPTISLGDTSSGTLFINAQTPPAAGASVATMATTSKIYDAANQIRVVLGNASGTVTSGKFTLVYRLIDLSANPDATATPTV